MVNCKWKRRREFAPAQDETRPARKRDEAEPTLAIEHRRENRPNQQQAKNTTGLRAAQNGDLQAQGAATA